jgi:3-oxoacid CoA-transferase
MNKIWASPEQAVADIADGATVAIAGFRVGHRFVTSLICALRDQHTRGQILAENNQVKNLIAALRLRWDETRFVLDDRDGPRRRAECSNNGVTP